MEQFLVAKAGVTYAAKVGGGAISGLQDAVNLTEGGIAVFTETGALIASDATEVAGDSITFAVKRNGDVKYSYPIYRLGYTKSEVAYSAPAKKKMAIGSNTDAGTTYNLNAPGTLSVGQVATVKVINLMLNHDDGRRIRTYNMPVVSGDTIITVMARLMAKVNADVDRIVNMTKIDTTNSDGYIFEAITAGLDFSLACEGILANADVLARTEVIFAGTAGVTRGAVSALTNLVNTTEGFGTSEQMKAEEASASTREGNHNQSGWKTPVYQQPSAVVDGETYNQLIVSSERPNDNVLIQRQPLRKLVHLAIPEGDANWAIMQNITTVFITPTVEEGA